MGTVLTISGVDVTNRHLREAVGRILQAVTSVTVTFEAVAVISCLPEECAAQEAAARDQITSAVNPTPAPTPPLVPAPTPPPITNYTRHLAEEESDDSTEDQLDDDACNRMLEPRLNGFSPEETQICL